MNRPDPKKFITGFLLIAIFVASGGFVVSKLFEPQIRNPQSAIHNPNAPGSAFHEELSADARETSSSETFRIIENKNALGLPAGLAGALGVTSSRASINLTDRLAGEIADQLASESPENIAAGALDQRVADLADTIAEFARNPSSSAEFALARATSVYAPHVIPDYTPQDIVRYTEAYAAAFAPITSQRTSPEDSASVVAILRDAVGRLGAEKNVPAPFVRFHLATLQSLSEVHAALTYDHRESNDPVKTLIGTEARMRLAQDALSSLRNEAELLSVKQVSEMRPASRHFVSLLQKILGIRTASAQVGISVPIDCAGIIVCQAMAIAMGVTTVNEWLSFGVQILHWARLVALQAIKDDLIHKLVQQTVKWIQGGGKPAFVTNWKGLLEGVADDALGQFIYGLAPQLCSSFGPLVRVALQPVRMDVDQPIMCTLSQAVNNVKAFADNFNRGGWVAYGAALQPSNNFFGGLIGTKGLLDRVKNAAEGGAQSDAKSGGGFLSTVKCVKSVTKLQICRERCVVQAASNPLLLCSCDLALANETVCLEEGITTPGQTLANTIESSLAGSPIHRIVNAQDVAALVDAFINFLVKTAINKLINLGKSGIGPGLMGVKLDAPVCPPDLSSCSNVPVDFRDECASEICQAMSCTGPPCPPAPPIGGEFCGGATGSLFRNTVIQAINTYSASSPIMNPDGSCNPNWHVASTADWDTYLNGVNDALLALGLTSDRAGDEIGVKRTGDNSCSEQFDILTSGGCAFAKFLYGISPAEF